MLSVLPTLFVFLCTATASTQHCAQLGLSADVGDCTEDLCRLAGNAHVSCDELHLFADTIDISLRQQQFAGATAEGHVLLVQGVNVVKCQRIVLNEDQISGRVDAATLEVRAVPSSAGAPPVSPERNRAVAHGTLERLDDRHLRVDSGDFTLCDCGPDELPSWRVDAAHIDIALDDRVTLWNPQIRIAVGDLMVPVTPPLAPLSIPLRSRALGLLPPEYNLYAGWPTVDLPVFIPLGESYDLKMALGMRFDWATHTAHPLTVGSFGAPRLGARLRYAPVLGTAGSIHAQWTHDGAMGMARRALAADLSAHNIYAEALFAQRSQLTDRVQADVHHVTDFGAGAEWIVDARWLSDDRLLQDFAVAITERYSAYWPSRSQLLWRQPQRSALLAADYVLRLDNVSPTSTGELLPDYSNIRGAEAGTVHRGPHVALQFSPTPVFRRLHADASASFVRYGTWTQAPPKQSPDLHDPQVAAQNIVGATAGLSYNDALGPVRVSLYSELDSALVHTAANVLLDTSWVTGAACSTQLARRYGNALHVVTPRLQYRALANRWRTGTLAESQSALLDERLLRRISHQAMLSVQQSLWQGPALDSTPQATLEVGQPIDLMSGTPLQSWAELSLSGGYGTGRAFTSMDTHTGGTLTLREIGAQYALVRGPWRVSAQYERLAPNADRFARSIYELAAPTTPEPDVPAATHETNSSWAHTLAGRVSYLYGSTLDASYGTTYQLPRPGQQGGEPACATPAAAARSLSSGQPLQAARACFTQHNITVGYHSPCACWGLSAMLSAVPQDLANSFRVEFFVDVAGYAMGGNATSR